MRRFLVACFFLLSACVSALAQSFTPDQMEGLKTRVATFEAGMRASDFKVMTDVIPRKVWDHIKTQSKLTDAQLDDGIKAALQKAFEKVKITDFALDLPKATTHPLADGMLYALIPTSTTMAVENGAKLNITSSTLAFMEDGKWYLMRVSDKAQVDILQLVYPTFKPVTFPEDKVQKIEDTP